MIDLKKKLHHKAWRRLDFVVACHLAQVSPSRLAADIRDGRIAADWETAWRLIQAGREWQLANLEAEPIPARDVTIVLNQGGVQNREFSAELKQMFRATVAPALAELIGTPEPVTGRIVAHFSGQNVRRAELHP